MSKEVVTGSGGKSKSEAERKKFEWVWGRREPVEVSAMTVCMLLQRKKQGKL